MGVRTHPKGAGVTLCFSGQLPPPQLAAAVPYKLQS